MSLCVHCCILFAYCINVTRDYIQVDVAIKTLCEEYCVSVCILSLYTVMYYLRIVSMLWGTMFRWMWPSRRCMRSTLCVFCCVHCCVLFVRCINVPGEYIQVDVAIKTLREEYSVSGKATFLAEAEVMVTLSHPCIVSLIGVCEGPPLMLVSNWSC